MFSPDFVGRLRLVAISSSLEIRLEDKNTGYNKIYFYLVEFKYDIWLKYVFN